MKDSKIEPKPTGGRPVRVIHRVNQKLVTSECRSVRDSNVTGFIELLDVATTNLGDMVGEDQVPEQIESLVLPKIVVVAICYPRPDGDDRVVLLHPAEHDHEDGFVPDE